MTEMCIELYEDNSGGLSMLTLRQAADRLGMRPKSVLRAVQRNTLVAEKQPNPATPAGFIWLVSEAEVERYAQEHRRMREDAR